MLSVDPVSQKYYGICVAESGNATFPLMEQPDAIEQVGLGIRPCTVVGVMHPPMLQRFKEAFDRYIVPAISLADHRAHHAVPLQPRLEGVARILASPVGVMDQAHQQFPMESCHRRSIHDDFRSHPRLNRSANDFPVEQVETRPGRACLPRSECGLRRPTTDSALPAKNRRPQGSPLTAHTSVLSWPRISACGVLQCRSLPDRNALSGIS